MGDQIYLSQEQDEIVAVSPYDMQQFEDNVTFFLNQQKHQQNLFKRVELAANLFLDQPYLLEPVGEGKTGKYSQEPLFRMDKFDCVSYVDTVLSLAKAEGLQSFIHNLIQIRYANKPVNYINRTDWFIDLEWLPNARRLGWLQDKTDSIVDENERPITKLARTIIDKLNWYAVKPLKVMHLLQPLPSSEIAQALLKSLRAHGAAFQAQTSTLTYLPLDRLFSNGKPNEFLFDQIPSPSMIAIVRPDWPIRDELPGFPQGYGTNLNVSHIGLAIRTLQGLMFFNASSLKGKVMFELLSDYLSKYLDSPTIKGIHLEKII